MSLIDVPVADDRDGFGLDNHPEYLRLKYLQSALDAHGGHPYFISREGMSRDTILSNQRRVINFAGYNYLGLAGHPEVSAAAKSAIDRFGTSVSASRFVSGQIPLHDELEESIAAFLGVESSIAFVSGHATNVTCIGYLFGRRDLLIHDKLAHNSIVTGCKLSEGHRLSFPHNDLERLEELLDKHRKNYERVVIIVEGLYSMDGDVPDLPALIDIKKRHDALLMIDEAHSLGVLGRTGRGIGEFYDVKREDVDIWMGTLSKALASCGGYIAGAQSLVENLRYSAPGFIYSVGMSPPNAAAALCALKVLDREPQRVHKLMLRAQFFGRLASELDLVGARPTPTPIVPVILGNWLKCIRLSHRLEARSVRVQPIIYPAVKANAARLRFFVTAMHSEDQVRDALGILTEEIRAL